MRFSDRPNTIIRFGLRAVKRSRLGLKSPPTVGKCWACDGVSQKSLTPMSVSWALRAKMASVAIGAIETTRGEVVNTSVLSDEFDIF